MSKIKKEEISSKGLYRLNNPNFNPLEFEGYLQEAGINAFTFSPKKWKFLYLSLEKIFRDVWKNIKKKTFGKIN